MSLHASQFQDRRFPAHGEVVLNWSGPLLLIDVRGPFNFELVRAAVKALAQIATQAPPGGCVEIVNWSGSMLMPPEGIAYFDEAMRRFAAVGSIARATLVVAPPQIEGRWLMLPQLLAIWERNRPVEVFEELDEALRRAGQLLPLLTQPLGKSDAQPS